MPRHLMIFAAIVVGLLHSNPARAADPDARALAVQHTAQEAAHAAVEQAIKSLPSEIHSIAVLPLAGDADGVVTDAVQHELVQHATKGLHVVVRDAESLEKVQSEFLFAGKNIDIMAEDQLREVGRMLGADAVVYGKVRQAGVDETGIRARVSILLYVGIVETGELAGSASTEASAAIEASSILARVLAQPWFVGMVVVVGGLALLGLVGKVLLSRKLSLATKPRGHSL